jgi:hypothetical protein
MATKAVNNLRLLWSDSKSKHLVIQHPFDLVAGIVLKVLYEWIDQQSFPSSLKRKMSRWFVWQLWSFNMGCDLTMFLVYSQKPDKPEDSLKRANQDFDSIFQRFEKISTLQILKGPKPHRIWSSEMILNPSCQFSCRRLTESGEWET